MSKLFNTLRDVLTPYANKINSHTEEIEEIQGDVSEVKADLGDLNERLTQQAADTITHLGEISVLVEPDNKYNPATSEIGALMLADGTVVPSYTNITASDYIPIEPNDTVYMCGVGASDNYIYANATINSLCWYDAYKNFIGGISNTNGYTITAENAAYIRFSFLNTGSFGRAKIVSLTLNRLPSTVADITEFFKEYYKSAYDLAETAFSASTKQIEAENKLNPSKVITASGISTNTGSVVNGTSMGVTPLIPVKTGDKIYLTAIGASDNYVYGSGVIQQICEYGADGEYLNKYGAGTNGYTVQSENAAYIRLSYSIGGSFGTAKVVSVTINTLPGNAAQISAYHNPYMVTAIELAEKALANSEGVNDKIIDCWGDSRTEMIFRQGTSYADYLQNLLGTAYCVSGHGKSSQASGMCAARLGSNEAFITVENGLILGSGNTHITGIKVSSGLVNNFFCYSTEAGIPCTLMSVKGKIYKAVYNTYDSAYFVREVSGSEVSCPQNTKMIVEDYNSKHHACIFWWGKNDMLTAAEGRSAIKTIYDDAVKYIGHDRFIILGETCSLSSDYESGKTLRTFVDSFNAQMAAAYPNNFVDINAWLSSEDALTSVGLTPTAEDAANIAKGWPCYQLMVYSTNTADAVHPNEKGREAIANRIYAWMQEHDWI